MYYPSLNNLYKTFEKVLKTSRFAIVPKSILLSKTSPQQEKNIYIKRNKIIIIIVTYMKSIRSSGVGNRPPGKKKKNRKSREYVRGGGGHGNSSN